MRLIGAVQRIIKGSTSGIYLSEVGISAYRNCLKRWSDDELISNFLYGINDVGLDESGKVITANDLMLDEWVSRKSIKIDNLSR